MTSVLEVAQLVKFHGPCSISHLAKHLHLTYEGVRQVVEKMQSDGLLEPVSNQSTSSPGRPAQHWSLTTRGEHLFPKHYDDLTNTLLTALKHGPLNGGAHLLAELATMKADALRSQRGALSSAEKLDALREIYGENDEFISVEDTGEGIQIVEHNCPYLNVALVHPGLCSVTTNAMSQILGQQVIRTETFQEGAGRCVFRVLDQPAPASFVLEN